MVNNSIFVPQKIHRSGFLKSNNFPTFCRLVPSCILELKSAPFRNSEPVYKTFADFLCMLFKTVDLQNLNGLCCNWPPFACSSMRKCWFSNNLSFICYLFKLKSTSIDWLMRRQIEWLTNGMPAFTILSSNALFYHLAYIYWPQNKSGADSLVYDLYQYI